MFLYSEKWDCQQGKRPLCIKKSNCRRKVVGSHKGLGAQKKEGRFWVRKGCTKKAGARGCSCLSASWHIARINLFLGIISCFSRSWVLSELLGAVLENGLFGEKHPWLDSVPFQVSCWWQLMCGDLLACHPPWWEHHQGSLCTASNSPYRAGANKGIRLHDACSFLPSQNILWFSDLCHLPQPGCLVGRGTQTKQGPV